MTGIIDHMEAIKIGRRIAERGLQNRNRISDLSSGKFPWLLSSATRFI